MRESTSIQNPISRRTFLSLAASSAVLAGSSLHSLRSFAATASVVPDVKALVFDVFGTVVDWRGSVIREGQMLGERKGYDIDWAVFADRWRAGYGLGLAGRRGTGTLAVAVAGHGSAQHARL